MIFPLHLWPTGYLFLLGLTFYYFILAGARTFEVNPGDELASGVAQFSFLITGTLGTLYLGYGKPIPLWNAIGSAVLLCMALSLYEWARRAIKDRHFHIAWTGEVPDELCEAGPYRYVRHPLYSSYILAFASVLAAFPTLAFLAIFLANVALFTHAAFSDERSIAASAIAADYASYKAKTCMFLPLPKSA
jgi:protein-S-isoprenylcysteine O-methyltransferase Ste14